MSWTISNYVALGTAIITLLTAGVIVWYTWETRRMRIASVESNWLFRDQIDDLRRHEMARRRLAAPLFDFKAVNKNIEIGRYELNFANIRSRALSVQIEPPSGVTASIPERTDVVTSSETFQILRVYLMGEALKGRNASFDFALKYRDELGTVWKAKYSWERESAILEDLNMENES